MKHIFIYSLFALLLMLTESLSAQVTIGSSKPTNDNAVLELVSSNKGLLLPRISLESATDPAPMSKHEAGMVVYNTNTSGTGANYVSPGFYYNTGKNWERMYLGTTNWFYMPPIVFDASADATGQKRNLYTEYANQFNVPKVKSVGAPISVPYLPKAKDLYYYITDYDTNVFANLSISEDGVLTYDIKASATETSYINVVFVIK